MVASTSASMSDPEITAFRTVARVLSEPSLLVDRGGRVVASNGAARQLFDRPLHGCPLDQLLSRGRKRLPDWLRLAAGSSQLIPGRFSLTGLSQTVYLEAAALRAAGKGGYVFVRMRRNDALMHRIVRLEEERQRLANRSEHDRLTGLPNRAAFDRRWGACWRNPRLTRIGLILLDVDDFKAYNDYYGHAAGDECLQRVGREIAQVCNEHGLFPARIGGEEFAAVASDHSLDQLATMAQHIVTEVAELGIPHESVHMVGRVTISAGVSVASRRRGTAGGLREAADAALYEAKFLGKNRVEVRPVG